MEHLRHLQNIFQELTTIQIILLPKKSFFAYLSVRLLRQRVDALGMTTAKAKLAATTQLAFSSSFKDLKAYLGLTGYLKQYIPYYTWVARSFQECKTLVNWSVNVKCNGRQKVVARTYITTPTDRKINAFHHLQQLFSQPSILLHATQAVSCTLISMLQRHLALKQWCTTVKIQVRKALALCQKRPPLS